MIKIKTNSLKAATFIAPTKDVRYYLNGVQIQVKDTGAVHVRAASGELLFDDCDRVIPSRVGADRAENYDFELLATAQKAMRTARGNTKGFYRVKNPETAGGTALICCEEGDFPRIVVMSLRAPRCFEGQ